MKEFLGKYIETKILKQLDKRLKSYIHIGIELFYTILYIILTMNRNKRQTNFV